MNTFQVYNGPSETFELLGQHSGVNLPSVQSTSNVVFVTFNTDSSVVSSGFSATFQALSAAEATTQSPGITHQIGTSFRKFKSDDCNRLPLHVDWQFRCLRFAKLSRLLREQLALQLANYLWSRHGHWTAVQRLLNWTVLRFCHGWFIYVSLKVSDWDVSSLQRLSAALNSSTSRLDQRIVMIVNL